MYLAIQGLVTAGELLRPIVCRRKTPSSPRSCGAFAEIGVVEADADVLEHADRDDAVEAAANVAVILEPEACLLGLPALQGSFGRARVLLLRQRDAGDARLGGLGEVEGEAAPAASDIKHRRPGGDAQLRGEVTPLGELGVVERLTLGLEIGAAVLLIGVEEELVEPPVEIVVVRHVPS